MGISCGKAARKRGGTRNSIKRGYRRGHADQYKKRAGLMGPSQDNGPGSQFLPQFRKGKCAEER